MRRDGSRSVAQRNGAGGTSQPMTTWVSTNGYTTNTYLTEDSNHIDRQSHSPSSTKAGLTHTVAPTKVDTNTNSDIPPKSNSETSVIHTQPNGNTSHDIDVHRDSIDDESTLSERKESVGGSVQGRETDRLLGFNEIAHIDPDDSSETML